MIFLYFSLCLLPLTISVDTHKKCLAVSSVLAVYSCPSNIYIYWWDTSWTFSSPGRTVPAVSASPHERCSSPFITLAALCWTGSSMSMSLPYSALQSQCGRAECGWPTGGPVKTHRGEVLDRSLLLSHFPRAAARAGILCLWWVYAIDMAVSQCLQLTLTRCF